MPECRFKPTNVPTTYRCIHCGFILKDMIYTPDRVHMECSVKKQPPCANLGIFLALIPCPTCAGNVQVKQFKCAVHGTCTIKKPVKGNALCHGCRDYKAKE